MRWRTLLVGPLVTVLLVFVVAGCTETPKVSAGGPAASPSRTTSAQPGSVEASTPALAAQKKAAGIAACPQSDTDVAAVEPKGLPDLSLPCLGGGRDVRLAGLRGTPMVINVWAQWCSPCRAEAPYLAALARTAGDRVLIMGIDYSDPRPDLAVDFAKDAGWTYPQLFDPDQRVTAGLRITAAPPQTVFVRADGTIAYFHVGAFTSEAQLLAAVGDHLGVAL